MKFRKEARYFKLGVTLLCVVIASIIFQVVFSNLRGFFGVIKSFIKVISPVLYGVTFAYLMNPVMKFVERHLYRLLSTRLNRGRREQREVERARKRLCHVIGIVLALALLIVIVYFMIVLVVPTIVENVTAIANPEKIMEYYDQIRGWLMQLLSDSPDLETWTMARLDDLYTYAENWISGLDFSEALVSVTTQIYSALKGMLDVLLGIVIAVYMLLSKDKFLAQGKKLLVAVFREDHCNRILEICSRTNKIFGGFVMGKIIDSMIIGLICYICMTLLSLPYPMLISVIIGVTNIIPFFGPLIGAIPSAFLILLTNPLQCFVFIVFIIVLQQFDGNILGPRILGDSVGLSSFWILISITVFSGLFGFAGMVLGVPVFAVLYMLLSDFVSRRLHEKGRPQETEVYSKINCVEDIELAQRMHEFAAERAAFHEDDPDVESYDLDDDLEIEDLSDYPRHGGAGADPDDLYDDLEEDDESDGDAPPEDADVSDPDMPEDLNE